MIHLVKEKKGYAVVFADDSSSTNREILNQSKIYKTKNEAIDSIKKQIFQAFFFYKKDSTSVPSNSVFFQDDTGLVPFMNYIINENGKYNRRVIKADKLSMKITKLDVDFIESKELSKKEEKKISTYIKKEKAKNIKTKIAKPKTKTKSIKK
jgi:hypothetical protein